MHGNTLFVIILNKFLHLPIPHSTVIRWRLISLTKTLKKIGFIRFQPVPLCLLITVIPSSAERGDQVVSNCIARVSIQYKVFVWERAVCGEQLVDLDGSSLGTEENKKGLREDAENILRVV